MSRWRSVKARRLLAALLRIGWEVAWQKGSHRRLKRAGWPNYTFAFHDEEAGPGLLAQTCSRRRDGQSHVTGLACSATLTTRSSFAIISGSIRSLGTNFVRTWYSVFCMRFRSPSFLK